MNKERIQKGVFSLYTFLGEKTVNKSARGSSILHTQAFSLLKGKMQKLPKMVPPSAVATGRIHSNCKVLF